MTPSQTKTHGTPNANRGTPSTPHPSVSATTPSPTQVEQQSRTINDVALEVKAISSALATALNRQGQQHVLAMESQTALTRQIKEMTERSKAETSALRERLDTSLQVVSGSMLSLKQGLVNRAEPSSVRSTVFSPRTCLGCVVGCVQFSFARTFLLTLRLGFLPPRLCRCLGARLRRGVFRVRGRRGLSASSYHVSYVE